MTIQKYAFLGKHIHEIILEMEHEWNSKNVKNKEDCSSTGEFIDLILLAWLYCSLTMAQLNL